MVPREWSEVLKSPAFVINLDRCSDRWEATYKRLHAEGFQDIRRIRAVDAKTDDLVSAWSEHGSPSFDARDHEFCETYKGKQGCFLSHANVLKQVIAEEIPFFLVFEDDVLCHPRFAELAPQYWAITPKGFDLLYLGAQIEIPTNYAIVQLPCFCTNAMAMTLDGAKKVYELILTPPVRTIDCILKEYQEGVVFERRPKTIEWFAWNGTIFPTELASMPKDWTKRNSGLIFQDEDFGSDVRPW
jgi:Glycosyltransferase family 25 (LPS biosynthesis protein)